MGVRPGSSTAVDSRQERENHEQAAQQHQHQETEAQIRARLQNQQNAERAQRQANRKDTHAWEASREQRAADARSRLAATWGPVAERPEAKAELATHAERMAQLNRILDVAQDKGDSALVTKANAVIQREIARDARALQGIRAAAGAQ